MRLQSWVVLLSISGWGVGCSDAAGNATEENPGPSAGGSEGGGGPTSTGSGGNATSSGGNAGSATSSTGAGGSSMNGGAGGVSAGAGGKAGASGTGGAGGGGGAGGKAGAGGGGGAGGGLPHVVGACDGLGAVDHFEEITPPQASLADNGITQVLVDPVHSGTIFAGTDKRGLFKSTNCGKDWTKVNTGRNGAVLDSGILWSMSLDFADPNVIYAGALYSSDSANLYKSTNGGVDWDGLYPKGSDVYNTVDFFQDLSMDPTDHKHIVVTFHNNCKGAFAGGCMAETLDSGATWRLFMGPLPGWSEGAGPLVLGGLTFIMGTTQNGMYYTSDSGAHWEKVAQGNNHQMYHAPTGSYYTGSDYGVNRSADGHTWTKIAGSPNGYGIMGDGKRLFNSLRNSGQNQQPYLTAPESDPTKWTPLASPNMAHGTVYFGYDTDHHVLYCANTSSGLWRMVTQ